MPHLRKLVIKFQLLSPANRQIFEKLPALEYLELSCESTSVPVSHFEILIKPLKRLKYFEYKNNLKMSVATTPALVRIAEMVAQNLRKNFYMFFDV